MSWYIGTKRLCELLVARLNAALGLPRRLTEADRIGGGIHVPIDSVPEVREWPPAVELPDGAFAVRVKPRIVRRLTSLQQSRVVDELPD